MTTSKSTSYDYLIKLLLIGDSGKFFFFIFHFSLHDPAFFIKI